MTELDAIRGLAALSILFYHLRPEISFGWTRVDLFLVLSGYLVTSIILKYHTTRGFLLVFCARRAIRIWPVYFLTLLALVVANARRPDPYPLEGLPYFLSFTQNVPRYWSESAPLFIPYFSHTWTLALEEQFYLVWPAVVCLAGLNRLIPLAAVLATASVTARAAGFHPWLLAARCDGLALGGLLAALLADRERVRRSLSAYRLGFGLVAVVALACLAWTLSGAEGRDYHDPMTLRPALTVFASNAFYFGLIGVLICGAGHPALGFLRGRRLAYLGSISYGIYLYHPMVFGGVEVAARRIGLGPSWGLDAVKVAAGIAVAALSWECLERPLLALKEHVPYQKSTGAAPIVPAPPPAVAAGRSGRPRLVASGRGGTA